MAKEESKNLFRILTLCEQLQRAPEKVEPLRSLLAAIDQHPGEVASRAQLGILEHFKALSRIHPLEKLAALIASLATNPGSPSAAFLAEIRGAVDLMKKMDPPRPMAQVYQGLLRTLTQSYTTDGTQARCPKCQSTNVTEGENSMYEFTHMVCHHCGHDDMADEYQLEDWYPK